MNREETINKTIKEYGKYGLERSLATYIYDSAIEQGVAVELIYPGMKKIFNNAYHIKDDKNSEDIANAFMEFGVRDRKESNPGTSDDIIKKAIAEEIVTDGTDKITELLSGAFDNAKESFENVATKFVKDNL